MPDQTRRLLLEALEGDERALGDLLERLRPRLLLWVGTRLSAGLLAKVEPEDVVQEILLAVHEGIGRFRGEDDRAFRAWLFTVAENRIRDLVDHFGAKKRRTPDPLARSRTSPSAAAARNEMVLHLRAALERLPDDYREVIRLRRLQELEVPEIAERMDRSPNAVRILYCRAIRALRTEMKTGETPGPGSR